jgi:tetratricopeptide (TPR) repeat protein
MDAIPVTVEVGEAQPAGEVRRRRPDNEGLRASLARVRAAQEAARARNRHETLKARLGLATFFVTIAAGWVVIHASAARTRKVPRRALAAAAAAAAPCCAEPAAAGTPSSLSAAAPEATPVAPSVDASANVGADAECEALSKGHHWRQAAESCALAVQLRPDDAALVLALAQSQHARNRLSEAAESARRAIALDSNLPEAFIILAHAEAHAGNPAAAARAFRRYLTLAPHGWHAREARVALRAPAR